MKNKHLLCYIVMTFTQRLPHTISEQHNKNNKNRHFSKRGPRSVFCQRHAQGIVITLGHTGYCTG